MIQCREEFFSSKTTTTTEKKTEVTNQRMCPEKLF